MTSEDLKPGDEDFFAFDCVKITISPPASRNEVMIIVTNQVFYTALENRIKKYIFNNPQNNDKALEYLNIIKSKLLK